MSLDNINEALYSVVINHEGQYSIWPSGRDLPPGWTAVGVPSARASCLAQIEQMWSDMRPLSLRTAANLP
jgi:MbtH protein